MSKPIVRAAWAAFLALALLPAGGAAAQETATNAERAQAAPRKSYGPTATGSQDTADCEQPGAASGEIVVCGFWQEGEEFRVQSTREIDPDDENALRDGLPRAPDVAGDGIFKGPATMSGGCFLQDCPPPPAYMVDFSTLPEAPEGSDADKIAKGEMPAP